ncbi:unnamed protein product [Knipowitschia caucasica]|uniref:C-type lectin domain-containing protein n=1 Tax=Knipowitschia caucasica TaxID=637954 RepID=A0AAV2KUS1_KNICA
MKLLLVCLLLAAVTTLTKGRRALCNPGTWCPYGGRSYIFIATPKSWAYAQMFCQSLGGTLAVIHNRNTNDFLRTLSSRMDTWIGFSDAQYNGVWLWINSERVVFRNWCRGEPNNSGGNQDCAIINFKGEDCWDDEVCMANRPFVCERENE